MLTETGDLLFTTNKRQSNKINLTFAISENLINLNFFLKGCSEIIPTSGIVLGFELNDIKTNTKKAKMIENLPAYRQACLIRIKTSLGQLPERINIGSKIETKMHDFLFKEETKTQVMSMAKEAIKDILPNATVTVTAIAKHTINGYKQCFNIKIYDEDLMILNYDLG